jgi:hypothetical protein
MHPLLVPLWLSMWFTVGLRYSELLRIPNTSLDCVSFVLFSALEGSVLIPLTMIGICIVYAMALARGGRTEARKDMRLIEMVVLIKALVRPAQPVRGVLRFLSRA